MKLSNKCNGKIKNKNTAARSSHPRSPVAWNAARSASHICMLAFCPAMQQSKSARGGEGRGENGHVSVDAVPRMRPRARVCVLAAGAVHIALFRAAGPGGELGAHLPRYGAGVLSSRSKLSM